MTIRVVIADNHPLMLDGLENLFRTEEDVQVVARCTDAVDCLEAVHRHQPDVLVIAMRMPGKDGFTITRELLAEKLSTKVVFYTIQIDEDQLLEAIRAGVRGIVLKEMKPQLLVQCVRKVHAGGQWIERHAACLSIEKLLQREVGVREISSLLTPREIGVLQLVAQGLRNRQIGEKLFISEGTVKFHLHNISEKLQKNGRVALLNFAREKGLA